MKISLGFYIDFPSTQNQGRSDRGCGGAAPPITIFSRQMEPQSAKSPQFDVLGDCRLVLFALLKDSMTKKKETRSHHDGPAETLELGPKSFSYDPATCKNDCTTMQNVRKSMV